MKDRLERLAVLPFSVGYVSHSIIAVIQSKRNKDLRLPFRDGGEEDTSVTRYRMKNMSGSFPMPKTNISEGLPRLIKTIRSNFSQLTIQCAFSQKPQQTQVPQIEFDTEMTCLAFKEEEEKIEIYMELGNPTDVKHVTHIGWDGSATLNTSAKGWDDFKAAEFFFLSPITLQQHGINIAAQADRNLFNTYCSRQA